MQASPRAAAALLRLALEKLCNSVVGESRRLNEHIRRFVAAGLPERLQKALDSIRVVGNNAAHPGQVDVEDDPEVVRTLFFLINYIADKWISEPKRVDGFFDEVVPEGEKARIASRNRGPVS